MVDKPRVSNREQSASAIPHPSSVITTVPSRERLSAIVSASSTSTCQRRQPASLGVATAGTGVTADSSATGAVACGSG